MYLSYLFVQDVNAEAVVEDFYYVADLKSYSDYMPFGMQMLNRNGSTGDYRYGFQDKEKDDEVKGEGNSVNYKYRMHVPRIGRFFAVDLLAAKFPHYTPYSFSGNKVIHAIEYEGLEEAILTRYHKNDGSVALKVYTYGEADYNSNKRAFWHYTMSSGNKDNWKKGYNAYRGGADSPIDNQIYSGSWSGKTYGTLIIDSYQDGRDSEIENTGVYDTYEDAKNGVMAEGAGEIVVGSIGIALSIVGEIGSGGEQRHLLMLGLFKVQT